MKNTLLKLLFVLFFTSIGFAFFLVPTPKTQAGPETCPYVDQSNPIEVTASAPGGRTDGAIPKVMPGETLQVKINNKCDTNIISNIYVHPASLTDLSGSVLNGYLKGGADSDYWIIGKTEDTIDVHIDGTGGAGVYKVRVVSYERGVGGTRENIIGTVLKDIRISSEGININGPDSVKKGDPVASSTYEIRLYGHPGEKFSLYVDDPSAGLKFKDLNVGGDPYPYSWAWDTSGTSPGHHTIYVTVTTLTGKILSESKGVDITDPSAPGGGGGAAATFDIKTRLNSFNIKNLLNSCKSRPDLDGILCIVDKLILWLLDIGAVLSIIMILYASIIYLTSYGDESKAELAKKTLIWSVIGVIVIGVAWSVMKIIEGFFNA